MARLESDTARSVLHASVPAAARLVYVMGASGAGKDTLLRYARTRVRGANQVVFAHRYITRESEPEREDFIPLSEAEFEERAAAGLFALHWRSHACDYGVGIEIDDWMARGFCVVVNGSRRHLQQARRRYPSLLPVLVAVSPSLLHERLVACGRELRHDPDATLDSEVMAAMPACARIDNDGPVGEAGERLVRLVLGLARGQASTMSSAAR